MERRHLWSDSTHLGTMFSTIIPFFLTANFSSDTAWPFGPEYVFKSTLSGHYVDIQDAIFKFDVKMLSDVFCRPKGEDTLSCKLQLESQYMWSNKFDTMNFTNIENGYTNNTDSVLRKPMVFDIKFDQTGITNYASPEKIRFNFVAVKMMMNDLSVGVDLFSKTKEHFQDKEKSLMGECMADFMVTKETPAEDHKSEIKYELLHTPSKESPVNIYIKKCRIFNDCDFYKPVTFADFYISFSEGRTFNLQNYCTETFMFNKEFKTKTHLEGTVPFDKNVLKLSEDSSLELINIRPAAEEWEQFESTELTPIYALSKE